MLSRITSSVKNFYKSEFNKLLVIKNELRYVMIIILGSVVSCSLALSTWWVHDQSVKSEFDRITQEARQQLKDRITLPAYGLAGARASYFALKDFSRASFRSYVEARNLEKEFPGVRGFAFVQRVTKDNIALFVAKERQDGAPDFTIKSLNKIIYEPHYVVRFIEPYIYNSNALGLDIGSESLRREAIEQAKMSGATTLTAPLYLVQGGKSSPGFLLNLPIYLNSIIPDDPKQRDHDFIGVINAPVVFHDLILQTGFMKEYEGQYNIRITDVAAASTESNSNLYQNISQWSDTTKYKSKVTLSLFGREFLIEMQSSSSYDQMHWSFVPVAVISLGVLFSVLIARHLRLAKILSEKKINDALEIKEYNKNYEIISNQTDNAVIFTDAKGYINWTNAGFQRLTGYSRDEVLGKNPGQLLQCDQTDMQEVALIRAKLRDNLPYVGELLNQAKDGRKYWVELRIHPIFEVDGSVKGFISIELDVTQRHLNEERLNRAILLNSNLVDAINNIAIVSIANKKGIISHVNDKFCTASGYSRKEMIGNTHALIYSGSDSVNDWSDVWETIGTGKNWTGQVCNRAKDGHLYWEELSVNAFLDPEGEIENYISISFDITSRINAEKESIDKSTLMYGAIDTIGEAFCLYDVNDRLVYFNEQYSNLYSGSAPAIVVGNTFENIIRYGAENGQYVDALGRVEDWVAERLAIHQAANTDIIQHLANGVILRIRERRTSTGYIVGFRTDITELMESKDAAQAAERSKSKFLANMSHEIRTPMNAILGMLTLLRLTNLSHQQKDYVKKAELSGKFLLGLLNDILDISKVSAGMLKLDNSPFRLDHMIRDLGKIFSATIRTEKVELIIDAESVAFLEVLGDRLRLHQALLNLGSNAIKFTETGHVFFYVGVTARKVGQVRVRFEVSDTGIGIEPGFQKSIFEEFTQASPATASMYGGSGLGLKITKQLIELMGSELQLESVLGKGSRFYFEVDLVNIDNFRLDFPNEPNFSHIAPNNIQALLLEDNAISRQILERSCKKLGWNVTSFSNGEEVIQHLCVNIQFTPAYDVILLDYNTPGVTGKEVFEKLRMTDVITPVIFMVTHNDFSAAQAENFDLYAAGDAILVKPVTTLDLYDAVANLRTRQKDSPVPLSSLQSNDAPLGGIHILLVEDNLINQQVGSELLMNEGAVVDIAANGQLAVDAVQLNPKAYDILLMDMQMPVMNGIIATQTIRESLCLRDLPIIAMTANVMDDDRTRCLLAGMNDHVSKPLDIDELVKVILRHVKLSK